MDDELCLPSGTFERHHAQPRRVGGDRGPVVLTDHVTGKGRVRPAAPAGSQDVPVVYVENGGIDVRWPGAGGPTPTQPPSASSREVRRAGLCRRGLNAPTHSEAMRVPRSAAVLRASMISGSIGTSRSAVPGMMIVLAWARRESPCGTRIVNVPVSTSSVSAHTEVRYARCTRGEPASSEDFEGCRQVHRHHPGQRENCNVMHV